MRGSWTFVERWVIFRIAEQSGLYTAPSVRAVRLQRFGSRASVVLFTAQEHTSDRGEGDSAQAAAFSV